MGAGQDFFDNLDLDKTQELPTNGPRADKLTPSTGEVEMLTRLMCALKCAMSEGMVTLRATPTGAGGEYVAVSKAWEEFFGWTLAEQNAQGINFFVEESRPIAEEHGEHSLAGPYIAKVYKKDTSEVWVYVHGYSWIFQGITWRLVRYWQYEG